MYQTYFDEIRLAKLLKRRKLKIVIIDNPYDTIANPLTQSLFIQTISLKIQGYTKEYPYGILPVDTTDFVGFHLLLCEEGEDLRPLMGLKTISLSRCKTFMLDFPIYHLLDGMDLPLHKTEIDKVLQHAQERGDDVAYSSAWTIAPSVRRDRELKYLCRDVLKLFFVRYFQVSGVKHILAGAALRFKVDELKKFVGYRFLEQDGKVLPPVECRFAFGEKAALMHLAEPSEEAKLWAESMNQLWEGKLIISGEKTIRKAA